MFSGDNNALPNCKSGREHKFSLATVMARGRAACWASQCLYVGCRTDTIRRICLQESVTPLRAAHIEIV